MNQCLHATGREFRMETGTRLMATTVTGARVILVPTMVITPTAALTVTMVTSAEPALLDHRFRPDLQCLQNEGAPFQRTAGVKDHSARLQEVHHPPGRLPRPEVLLQEGQDHQLLNRQLPAQNHQKNLPPEAKAGGKIGGIKEGNAQHVLLY